MLVRLKDDIYTKARNDQFEASNDVDCSSGLNLCNESSVLFFQFTFPPVDSKLCLSNQFMLQASHFRLVFSLYLVPNENMALWQLVLSPRTLCREAAKPPLQPKQTEKTLRASSNLTLSIFPEHETYFERVSEVQRLVDQLPEPNKRMLEMLMSHLEKVDNITCAMLS